MDWYTALKKLGFLDPFNNGLSARKSLPDSDMEICWYRRTNKVIFQTKYRRTSKTIFQFKGSGAKRKVIDVSDLDELGDFWEKETGQKL